MAGWSRHLIDSWGCHSLCQLGLSLAQKWRIEPVLLSVPPCVRLWHKDCNNTPRAAKCACAFSRDENGKSQKRRKSLKKEEYSPPPLRIASVLNVLYTFQQLLKFQIVTKKAEISQLAENSHAWLVQILQIGSWGMNLVLQLWACLYTQLPLEIMQNPVFDFWTK